MYLYDNEVLDDDLNMIVRYKVRDLLNYDCGNDRM